jgi:hypothetical protein
LPGLALDHNPPTSASQVVGITGYTACPFILIRKSSSIQQILSDLQMLSLTRILLSESPISTFLLLAFPRWLSSSSAQPLRGRGSKWESFLVKQREGIAVKMQCRSFQFSPGSPPWVDLQR